MKFQTSGNITEDMVVTNLSEFIEKSGLDTEDDSLYDENHEMDIASQIIALQAAYFIMRRTAYLCGSNGDVIWSMIRALKTLYKTTTGREFQDFNEDTDW